MSAKIKCHECWWKGVVDELLTAAHPFMEDEIIHGCPKCRDVNTLDPVCDEPDCWATAGCGTPTESGYRRTCHKHMPKEAKQ